MTKKFKILTLDGGGSKGVYSLGILNELEKKLGGSLLEHFDGFYGCSTGAIIAACLVKGKTVEEIKELYFKYIPHIMQAFQPSTRSKRLKEFLEKEFGNDKFDTCQKFLGIIATSLDDNAPKIFKSNMNAIHASEATAAPGFEISIAHALLASCSAQPFFEKATVSNKLTQFNLMDGGFSANNPTLFAIIDGLKAFKINEENLTIVNIGTGNFPESIPISTSLNFCHLPSKDLITTILNVNTNTDSLIVKLLLKDMKILRISDEFSSPQTSILESNKGKLETLFNLGTKTFGKNEKKFNEFWN